MLKAANLGHYRLQDCKEYTARNFGTKIYPFFFLSFFLVCKPMIKASNLGHYWLAPVGSVHNALKKIYVAQHIFHKFGTRFNFLPGFIYVESIQFRSLQRVDQCITHCKLYADSAELCLQCVEVTFFVAVLLNFIFALLSTKAMQCTKI